jgi:hypothetical protein
MTLSETIPTNLQLLPQTETNHMKSNDDQGLHLWKYSSHLRCHNFGLEPSNCGNSMRGAEPDVSVDELGLLPLGLELNAEFRFEFIPVSGKGEAEALADPRVN